MKVGVIVILLACQFSSSMVVRSDPKSNRPSPPDRKLLFSWDRNVEFDRHVDRERFREDLFRTMQELLRNSHTTTQLNRMESETLRDLERRFNKAKTKIDRMTYHTVGAVNDLLALT